MPATSGVASFMDWPEWRLPSWDSSNFAFWDCRLLFFLLIGLFLLYASVANFLEGRAISVADATSARGGAYIMHIHF